MSIPPSQHEASVGSCPVCRRVGLRLINTSGLLWNHGPRDNQCAGSHTAPLFGSIRVSTSASSTPHAQQRVPILSGTSADVVDFDKASAPDDTLSHPIHRGPTLKKIPKAARNQCAVLLSKLIREVVADKDNVSKWANLLSFGNSVLSNPKRGGAKRNLSNVIISRVNNFPGCSSNDDVPIRSNRRANQKKLDPQKSLASIVSSKIEDGNFKAAVRILCSDDKPATVTEEIFESLRLKHPCAPDDRHISIDLSNLDGFQPLVVSESEVRIAIQSFPAGSAGGPDGLRPQHLKDLIILGGDIQLLLATTEFVNILLEGNLSSDICKIIYGGNLIALEKKDGGLRPIAIGYTLRRLAAKCANTYALDKISAVLAPRQLGSGISRGAEAAVHAARKYLQYLPDGYGLVKLDFKNAFNTLRRDNMLEAVAKSLPEIYRFVYSTYAFHSTLQLGQFSIPSEEGIQQGDPLGPLEFCLSIQPLLEDSLLELVIGYLDDVTLGGPVDILASDIERIRSAALKLGLILNEKKCEVIINDKSLPLIGGTILENFTVVQKEEAYLLGAPLLPGHAVDMTLTQKCDDLRLAMARLKLLQSHDALVILRNSLSLPKLLYLLRTSACTGNILLQTFDDILKEGLSGFLNVSISDENWLQASLPVSHGGLGIRSAVQLASSAFLASAAGVTLYLSLILPERVANQPDSVHISTLDIWMKENNADPPIPTVSHIQKSWDDVYVTRAKATLLANASDDYHRARILASQSPAAGGWLKALPLSSIGLRMDDETIRVAVSLRLGTVACEPHFCPCGARVDARGSHSLSCRKGSSKFVRHNLLNDVIWRAMKRAQIPSFKEPPGLIRTNEKRPDGVTMIPWSCGKCLAWDVTIPDTVAASHQAKTSQTACSAAEEAAIKKHTKYEQLSQTHHFVAVAVETFGSWSVDSLDFVNELGRRIALVSGDKREAEFLRQRLSVALQRGNSAAFRECMSCF